MSKRGVWQLVKMTLRYCEFSGSSRGVREWVQSGLPQFRAANPHLDLVTQLNPGQHPHVIGNFRAGATRVVSLRNADPAEILRQASLLRSSKGRKTTVGLVNRHETKRPSVQGTWQALTAEQQAGVAAMKAADAAADAAALAEQLAVARRK